MNFLVVWGDERNATDDIYCARVNQQGNLLDQNGILVSSANDDQRYPAVAFNGTNYFIVWEDQRSGVDDDIYGARVTTSGTVLDQNGIVISNASGDQEDPRISFDGTNYLVVWDDDRSGVDDVYGARVTTSGTVLDPNGIPISTANDQQEYASVVFNGTNFFVAWDDYRNYSDTADVYCAKVTTGGAVFQETALVSGWGNQFYTSLAHGSGSQVLLAFNGWTSDYQGLTVDKYRVWGKFVSDPSDVFIETNTTPTEFILYQNYPNPFNPSTIISWQSPVGSHQVLKVFDVLGNEVATLVDEYKEAGNYEVYFNAASLSSGVYFYRLNAGDYVKTMKMVLLK
ncbi:MAG: T9SS type A sorting domain-containing protein [Ignavibacteriaceae bacterium]|nr:T9SS type A sorting domain-containing protein [Ignavibacteriaceae bacterium]